MISRSARGDTCSYIIACYFFSFWRFSKTHTSQFWIVKTTVARITDFKLLYQNPTFAKNRAAVLQENYKRRHFFSFDCNGKYALINTLQFLTLQAHIYDCKAALVVLPWGMPHKTGIYSVVSLKVTRADMPRCLHVQHFQIKEDDGGMFPSCCSIISRWIWRLVLVLERPGPPTIF